MDILWQALIDHPEVAVFLALGGGFFVGKFKIKGIGLGAITGTLLVGVVIGALVSVTDSQGNVETIVIPDVTKAIFFLLFLFALGYRVGPQFFAGLRGSGQPQAVFTLILIAVGIGAAIGMSLLLGYNPGLAAGLTAGALTQSSIIGVAQEAIAGLDASSSDITEWQNLVSVGYAVTYIFGTIGAAIFCASIAPRVLGIRDLPAAAKEEEKELGFEEPLTDTQSAYMAVERRVYTVPDSFGGMSMEQMDDRISALSPTRSDVDRARTADGIAEIGSAQQISAGDTVVIAAADVSVFTAIESAGFQETQDVGLLDFPIEELDIVVTNKNLDGMSLKELAGRSEARGIFIKKLSRSGHEMPLLAETEINQGDVVRLQGPRPVIESVIPRVGYPDRQTNQTDMVMVGLGIAVGALIGIPAVTIDNVPLTLTSSVGAMLIGLILGWRRSKEPTFGHVPPGAQWFFETVGLAAFVGIVGINAGPGFIDGLSTYGFGLFFAGVIVTLTPLVLMTFAAKWVFHFDPVQTLGMLTGAQTTTAAIGAVREAADSSVPLLGFTVPYAIGNIVLTVGGAIVVAVMA